MSGLRQMLRGVGLTLLLALPAGALAWLADVGADGRTDDAVPVQVGAPGAVDGRLPFRSTGEGAITARLAFTLPEGEGDRWVLWLSRDALDEVRVSAPGWVPPAQHFHAAPDDAFPAGYAFPLPAEWRGAHAVQLSLVGGVRAAPQPRIISDRTMLRIVARDRAIASAIYAAMLTLAIAALALYAAVRDRAFLWFALYACTALLLAAAMNGHLVALLPRSLLAAAGAGGFWATMLVFAGVGVRTVLRYAEDGESETPGTWRLLPWAYVAAAAVALLAPHAWAAWIGWLASLGWIVAVSASFVLVYAAARRGVSMAVAMLVLLALVGFAGGAHELMQSGRLPDNAWTRYGYQCALVLFSVVLYVGLCSRVGAVRQRLDDEAQARRASEQRLRREQVRGDLAPQLQAALRDAEDSAVGPVAFGLLAGSAQRLLGCGSAAVLVEAYLGDHGLRLHGTDPASAVGRSAMAERARIREAAQAGAPVVLRLGGGTRGGDGAAADHAVVPLAARAGGWGALVVRLPLHCVPEQAELAALDGIARLVVLHAQEAHAAAQLRRTAELDSLTCTLNRHSLDRVAADAFAARQGTASPLSVLFIDLDWFKPINDTHGHACGDHCLRVVAQALCGQLRPGDVVGRYGGEEFLVLLPGSDAAAARVLAERLRRTIEGLSIEWEGRRIRVTASFGLAGMREQDTGLASLLARADKALYQAKREGRNCVRAASAYAE